MFTFRSARSEPTGPTPTTEQARPGQLTIDESTCDHAASAVSDPSRRISSHRTSHGHVVYYRCDCGIAQLALMRWSNAPAGASRLR